MSINVVTLTNGHAVAEVTIGTTLLSADTLARDPMGVIAFFELVTMAKDPTHQPFGNAGEILERYGLLSGGVMHDDVRAIIDATYEINGFDVVKKNPVMQNG